MRVWERFEEALQALLRAADRKEDAELARLANKVRDELKDVDAIWHGEQMED